jgi:hypothetical protein
MENSIDILNELKELSPTLAAIEKLNVFTVPAGYFEYLSSDILMGIDAENGLLDITSTNSSAEVPLGYFDSLAASILDKIKAQDIAETEIDILSSELINLRSKNVFEVPAGYFDSLAGSILAKIKTAGVEDAVAEIRALSPMLYSIQNEHVFKVPPGYFENLNAEVLDKVNEQPKVVTMQRRSSSFAKYAVAAAFTGLVALSVFKFTGSTTKEVVLPGYVTAGLKVQDVDQELAKISDDDIVKYLEANGTDVKAAMVANSVDENELPTQDDYLMDEKALDKYLNSINVNDLKN